MSIDQGNQVDFKDKFESGFAGGGSSSGGDSSITQSGVSSLTGDISFDFTDDNSNRTASEAVLRVVSILQDNPYLPYISAAFSVQQNSEGTKVFVGTFDTDSGDTIVPIQIPLIGQSLEQLADTLNEVVSVQAQVMNGAELVDARELVKTGFYLGTDRWAYFWLPEESSGEFQFSGGESSLKQNIKFYLTSIEPNMSQNNPTQSLGGFISPTEVYKTDVLKNNITFSSNSLETKNNNLSDSSLIQIQDEIISVDAWNNGEALGLRRQFYETPRRFHPRNAVIRDLEINKVFDSNLSNEQRQYRCFAIRNETDSEFAKNVKVYFNILSRNILSRTRLAIELPRSDYRSATANAGGVGYLTDSNLAGQFGDGHFVTAALTLDTGGNSGQTRIVSDYNGVQGTFFFDFDLPNVVGSGDSYTVDTAPSQRIFSGTVAPQTDVANQFGPFREAEFFSQGVDINIDNLRANGSTLGPREAIYVWIERIIEDVNEEFENNRISLTVDFSRV